jgi:hypothetical protein
VRKNLTEIGLQNLKPKSKPYEISDTKSALRVAVHPSGTRSLVCRYRFAGRTRNIPCSPACRWQMRASPLPMQ